jgi:hypothetical protein
MNNIIVNNTDNQLNVSVNGVLDVYSFTSIKSLSRGLDTNGNYYVIINFKSNDKNNPLRIPLLEVTSPAGWTNDVTGADQAIADIRLWMSITGVIEVAISEANDSILVYGFDGADNQPLSVNATGQVAIQDGGNSITVDGGTGLSRTTGMLRPNNGGDPASGDLNTVQATFFSVSVANVGSSDGTVLGKTIKPNESLNFTADAINNYFSSFTYDATGTEFILIYVY